MKTARNLGIFRDIGRIMLGEEHGGRFNGKGDLVDCGVSYRNGFGGELDMAGCLIG